MPFEAADDPAAEHLSNGGWNKYTCFVFQTNWQQSMYNLFLGIPYSAGIVLRNAITPVKACRKSDTDINLLYVGDPRNGLDIVFSVFKKLSPIHPNLTLYVFSNFGVLGNIKQNKPLSIFHNEIRKHPKVVLRSSELDYLQYSIFEKCHILLAPNLFPHASAVPLLECMSAEMLCLHSSYGCLPEVSLGLTSMYGYTEDNTDHANKLYIELSNVIGMYNKSGPRQAILNKLAKDKVLVDNMYDWEKRLIQWNDFLLNLLTSHRT
jgi:hypothetical protein